MNGEVNGTVTEAMEASGTGSPDNQKHNITGVGNKSDDHCENSNGVKNNHVDLKIEPSDENEKVPEVKKNDLSKEPQTESPHKDKSTVNSEIDPAHLTDSSKQINKTVKSEQSKSDITDQEKVPESEKKGDVKLLEKKNTLKVSAKAVSIEDEDSDEIDSEEDSSDEGESVGLPQAQDTVSINSDSDSEGDSSLDRQLNKNDVIIIDNEVRGTSYNGSSCDVPSPEIHEILSDNDDDCVVTKDDKSDSLRRSSRGVKRKRYDDVALNGDDGESDVEEVVLEDPLKKKVKPILISDTRSLIDVAVKQTKTNQGYQKKDAAASMDSSASGKNALGKNSKNVNVFKPISVKSGNSVTPQPAILPSLTDDMFVVEAPSFIVPYVYEKPSMKPFREFVDILGRELEEQKIKEEKERVEKEKELKMQRDKEKQERRDRGEEVVDSEDEKEKEEAKKKKEEKRERRRRKKEDDDVSWDGESSSESEDEILSDEEGAAARLRDKLEPLDELRDVVDLGADKHGATKTDNYFDCSLGKFFMNIGLNLVQEFVQTDLLKQQNRKLYREKKGGHSTKSTESSIASLMKNLEFSKENNAPYAVKQKKCEFCSFKTESSMVMANHLETPHMKNNMYKCNYCSFEVRSPHDILYHMEAEHNVRGRLERAPAYHQCANCQFEDNGKGKLARHLIPCSKKFKPEINLSPPVEWEPPAKIPKITRSRSSLTAPYAGLARAGAVGGAGAAGLAYKARARPPPSAPRPLLQGASVLRGGVTVRPAAAAAAAAAAALPSFGIVNNGKTGKSQQPSISITPLGPHAAGRAQLPAAGKASFVICEICDGYIKDLEQLRNHMQWIHKVKIHPKMIHNRPPLNCQKCQFRFFTDQGLERHLLGSHGLVTSSMQEAANKGKDAGRCPVCGRVYQWKLLAHVARDHNLTLKPAHLSYKCTVCTATFGMYKQFESHVYSAHSVVAKRVVEKGEVPSQSKPNHSLLKPMKINDEITIIPQPVKPAKNK